MEITPLHLKFIAVVGCFPISGVGLALALFAWIKHGKHVDWQPVQGTIVLSGVSKYLGSTGRRSALLRELENKTYHQTIEYSYRVNGKEYVNDVIRLGERFNTVFGKEGAREAHLKYKTGSPVTIYFDPRDPANSVLEPNYMEHHFLMTIGLLSAATGGILWLLATHMSLP